MAKAIELNPSLTEAYNYKAWTYKLQGKKAEAIADLEKPIALTDNLHLVQIAKQQIEELAK